MTRNGKVILSGVLSSLAVVVLLGQTISTDGKVQAQGFTGDGSELQNVSAVDSDQPQAGGSTRFAGGFAGDVQNSFFSGLTELAGSFRQMISSGSSSTSSSRDSS